MNNFKTMSSMSKIRDMKSDINLSPSSKSTFMRTTGNNNFRLTSPEDKRMPIANSFYKSPSKAPTSTEKFLGNQSVSARSTILNAKEMRASSRSNNFSPPKFSKYTANNKYYSSNNLAEKIVNTKNELLNLKKEDKLESDFESKRLINRGNLTAFSPRKSDDGYQKFISNTLGIFKTQVDKRVKDTDSLANRIFNRNKSPLKSENEPLTSTFRKQNKIDLFKARNEIVFNAKRHMFAERKVELINLMKSKPGSEDCRELSPSNTSRVGALKNMLGLESKLDTFIEKKPALSLKQMDTNLKYSKIDFCTYYSSQPKIKKATNLNDWQFTRSQNQIAKLLTKHC
mmetsp:Transcript_397/g.388  ORF Transcript_397/g.388 Transcript_397/m.388 type:complete len:342 (+) Transcript_397:17-1042(+)